MSLDHRIMIGSSHYSPCLNHQNSLYSHTELFSYLYHLFLQSEWFTFVESGMHDWASFKQKTWYCIEDPALIWSSCLPVIKTVWMGGAHFLACTNGWLSCQLTSSQLDSLYNYRYSIFYSVMLLASEYAPFTIQRFSIWCFFKQVPYNFPWVWTSLLLGHMFVNTLPHSFGHPLVIDMRWPIRRPRSGQTIWSAMTCRALNLLCL